MAYLGKYGDPRQHPDDFRRERSGFWTHEYRMDNAEHIWRCDLRKMHEAVRDLLMDREAFEKFSHDPRRCLDSIFGEGTARAYFTKHPANEHYMNYRMSREMMRDRYMGMDPARGRDDMALGYKTYDNTFTNTTATTSGTIGAGWFDMEQKRAVQEAKYRALKVHAGSAITNRRLTGVPFKIEYGSNLIDSLQRQFDNWTKDQLELVRG